MEPMATDRAILLVEDNEDDIFLMKRALSSLSAFV